MIATDHAPHAVAERQAESIWDIGCGFPGGQTSLNLMLEAAAAGRIAPEDIAG